MNNSTWLGSALLSSAILAHTLIAADELYIVVTPDRPATPGALTCRIAPETEPPAVKEASMRFRVTLEGTATPVRWRLPLYQTSNGANDIRVARVGEGKPDKARSFLIRVTAEDLGKTEGLEELRVELRTRDGRETSCATAAEPLRVALRQAPASDLTVPEKLRIEGAVGR